MTQVTDWTDYGHYGFAAYRIWTQFDGRSWWQRHEWKREDGSIDLQDWIPSIPGHAHNSRPVASAEAA